ncbi:hypothetical protein ACM1RC_32560, partial [Paenibacillus azoreducens]|uniref:hypothetical protein n=1 Tax=Paenibacillus azoreducens TaxID=116718 RepID=UPI0039F588CD
MNDYQTFNTYSRAGSNQQQNSLKKEQQSFNPYSRIGSNRRADIPDASVRRLSIHTPVQGVT